MSIIKKIWSALQMRYLGGEVLSTMGSVKGAPAMGTTADLLKASGEIRVHLVRTKEQTPLVTLELLQEKLPGDGSDMACVQLSVAEATRLAALLRRATEEAAQQDGATDAAPPRG